MKAAALAVLALAAPAHADNQLQLDLGIGVVGVGMELGVSEHLNVQMEAMGFSTFYLPVIGGGVETWGAGAGVRPTWIAGKHGRGLFVTPFFRLAHVAGDKANEHGHGLATASGIVIGQAFRLGKTIDLRFGFGGQYITYDIETDAGTLTARVPFLAIDIVIGFRR